MDPGVTVNVAAIEGWTGPPGFWISDEWGGTSRVWISRAGTETRSGSLVFQVGDVLVQNSEFSDSVAAVETEAVSPGIQGGVGWDRISSVATGQGGQPRDMITNEGVVGGLAGRIGGEPRGLRTGGQREMRA